MAQEFSKPVPEEGGLFVPSGEIFRREAAVKDLPLYLVLTSLVLTTGLPKKEFRGEDDFEETLDRYAREKFKDPGDREKFIKKQKRNALYLKDEIMGESAWQFNGDVHIDNAVKCGFGVLKSEARQYYMFQTPLGMDLPSQFAAYQALTFRMVQPEYRHLFASREMRAHFKNMIGADVYPVVLEALGIAERVREQEGGEKKQ